MEPYTGNPWSKLYTVIVIALAVRLCIFAILAEDKKKQFFYLVSAALGVAGLYASILLPLFLSEPRSPMRAIVGFWGIPLLLTVYGNCIKCDHWKARGVNAIIGVAAALLVFVNIYNCAEIGVGLYKTNAMDTMRAELMANAIEEYEQESGNVVENVAFHADDAPMYSYPGIHSSYESNRSALNVSWSDIYVLNTVSGRNFQQVDYPDDLYEEQYAGKNWDIWSDEQITFLGDTAYIILY